MIQVVLLVLCLHRPVKINIISVFCNLVEKACVTSLIVVCVGFLTIFLRICLLLYHYKVAKLKKTKTKRRQTSKSFPFPELKWISYKALRFPVPRSPTYPTEFPLLYFHVGELVLPVMNALHCTCINWTCFHLDMLINVYEFLKRF